MVTLGEIIRWLIYTIDRWYRRIAAWVLRRDRLVASSERKFRALLESAPDAVVIVDWHGHVELVNGQAERLFGWSRGELVGQNVSELVPDRLRGRHYDHVKSFISDARRREMGSGLALYGRRKDGSEFPVEISLSPLETDQGLLVTAAIRDISARNRAEAALREAEQHFRTAFEEAPVGIALVALDGRVLRVNRALCEILGYAREQLEATTVASIVHPDDLMRDGEARQRLVAGEPTRYRAERTYIDSAGNPVPVDLSVAVVRSAEGDPQHFLMQLNDISERSS